MGLFGRRRGYDRKLILSEAREFQSRGKHKGAVNLLRQILAVEPNNVEIHALIAPSLAEIGLEFCAWTSYGHVAAVLLRDGKKKLALGYYRDATKRMPQHHEAWMARVALTRSMGRKDDAKQILERALPHFRRRASRHYLIAQLRCLLEIVPGDKRAILELSYVLSKTGQKYASRSTSSNASSVAIRTTWK